MESTKAVETAKKEGVIFPSKDATPKKTDTFSEQNLEYLNELFNIKWQKGSFLSQLAGKQNENEIIQQLKPLTEKVKDFNRILNEKRTAMEPLTDELDKMLAQAKLLTSNKNTSTIGTYTIINMDEFLAQWTKKEYCEDYANRIHQSPEHDFLGELIRNQNEEPILAPKPVKPAEPKPSPVPTPLPKPALTKHCKEEAIAKAEDEVKAKSGTNSEANNVKEKEEVDLEKLKEEEIVERKKKAEKKKLARARKKALKEAEEKIKLCAEPKPSPMPTPLPKPALTKHCKEEAIAKAEDEVKAKSGTNSEADNVKEEEEVDLEKLKEEEIAKNKMALERKKKLAEKKLARAEKKAIKEAEEKIKKKEKKAKKKGAGSAPEGSKDVTETELNPEVVEAENDSKDESETVQSKFKPQKESSSTVIRQRGGVKKVQSQIPRAILRKKSHSYQLSWAPLSALVLLVLAVLLGLYYYKYYYLARHEKS